MAYVSTFVRPVFLVRWTAPALTDTRRVTEAFERAFESAGQPIIYVAIVPQSCEPPNENVRKSMTKGRDAVIDSCVSMHIVMEGEGFRHAILRNALAGMLLFGKKHEKILVHRTLEEALDAGAKTVPEALKFDKKVVLALAIKAGVATPPEIPAQHGKPGPTR